MKESQDSKHLVVDRLSESLHDAMDNPSEENMGRVATWMSHTANIFEAMPDAKAPRFWSRFVSWVRALGWVLKGPVL